MKPAWLPQRKMRLCVSFPKAGWTELWAAVFPSSSICPEVTQHPDWLWKQWSASRFSAQGSQGCWQVTSAWRVAGPVFLHCGPQPGLWPLHPGCPSAGQGPVLAAGV